MGRETSVHDSHSFHILPHSGSRQPGVPPCGCVTSRREITQDTLTPVFYDICGHPVNGAVCSACIASTWVRSGNHEARSPCERVPCRSHRDRSWTSSRDKSLKDPRRQAFIALWIPTGREEGGPTTLRLPGSPRRKQAAAALGSLASVALSSEPATPRYRAHGHISSSPSVSEMRQTQPSTESYHIRNKWDGVYVVCLGDCCWLWMGWAARYNRSSLLL
jgi:hypothetical protein